MIEKTYVTQKGGIHYWVNEESKGKPSIVFLPGLTADHRLFDKQIDYFKQKYRVLVWDPPAHANSRPFKLDFSIMDKAKWLYQILKIEEIRQPIIIGQSMGGYVAQSFIQAYPNFAVGFISIDSAPLKREYTTFIEKWMLKKMKFILDLYSWKQLVQAVVKNTAETTYGRKLMLEMTKSYTKSEYIQLAAYGYQILAEAMEQDLAYDIICPTLLICGEKDKAGSAKAYNRKWGKKEGFPLIMIKGAGHNSNTDKPNTVNRLIQRFVTGILE